MSTFPDLLTSYHDGTATVDNTIFPEVSNYEDSRLLVMMVLGSLSAFVLLLYTCGLCCRFSNRFDAFSQEKYVVGLLQTTAFRVVPKTSKFGGVMTLAAIFATIAVCADVVLQYGYHFTIESTSVFFPLSRTDSYVSGRVTVDLFALASHDSNNCSIQRLGTSGYSLGQWKLRQTNVIRQYNASMEGTSVGAYTRYCHFLVESTDQSVVSPHFIETDQLFDRFGSLTNVDNTIYLLEPNMTSPVRDLSAESFIELYPNLKLLNFTVRVYDSHESSYTEARLSQDLPKDRAWTRPTYVTSEVVYDPVANATFLQETLHTNSSSWELSVNSTAHSRTHTLNLLLTGARREDHSFFDSVGTRVRTGHRASALSLFSSTTSSPGSFTPLTAAGDQLRLSLRRRDELLLTRVEPRLGVLALMGVVGGLAALSLAFFRALYELFSACGCIRLQRSGVLARLRCQQKHGRPPLFADTDGEQALSHDLIRAIVNMQYFQNGTGNSHAPAYSTSLPQKDVGGMVFQSTGALDARSLLGSRTSNGISRTLRDIMTVSNPLSSIAAPLPQGAGASVASHFSQSSGPDLHSGVLSRTGSRFEMESTYDHEKVLLAQQRLNEAAANGVNNNNNNAEGTDLMIQGQMVHIPPVVNRSGLREPSVRLERDPATELRDKTPNSQFLNFNSAVSLGLGQQGRTNQLRGLFGPVYAGPAPLSSVPLKHPSVPEGGEETDADLDLEDLKPVPQQITPAAPKPVPTATTIGMNMYKAQLKPLAEREAERRRIQREKEMQKKEQENTLQKKGSFLQRVLQRTSSGKSTQ